MVGSGIISVITKFQRPHVVPIELGDFVDTINDALEEFLSSGHDDPDVFPNDVPDELQKYWDSVDAKVIHHLLLFVPWQGVAKIPPIYHDVASVSIAVAATSFFSLDIEQESMSSQPSDNGNVPMGCVGAYVHTNNPAASNLNKSPNLTRCFPMNISQSVSNVSSHAHPMPTYSPSRRLSSKSTMT